MSSPAAAYLATHALCMPKKDTSERLSDGAKEAHATESEPQKKRGKKGRRSPGAIYKTVSELP